MKVCRKECEQEPFWRLDFTRESSGGITPLNTSKEDKDQNTSKGDEEAKSSCRRLSFGGRTLAHFTEILEEEIEWLKF